MVCTMKHCTFLTDCVVDFLYRRRFECRNSNLKKTLCLIMEFCCAELQIFFFSSTFFNLNHQIQLMKYAWSSCCSMNDEEKAEETLNEALIQFSNQPTEKCSKIQYERFYCGLNQNPTTCVLITDVLAEGDSLT